MLCQGVCVKKKKKKVKSMKSREAKAKTELL